MIELDLFQMYHLKEMSLSAELFLSCSILQLTFYAVGTAYQRKHGFVILSQQIYHLGMLIVGLAALLIINEDLLTINSLSSNNFIINDYLGFVTKLVICLTSVLFFLIIKISYQDELIQNNFEYVVLVTISVLGLLLLCSSNDLITAYLAIELQSVAFYIMSAFKKNSSYSVESGLKYFIIGSLSSAFFLFGSSLIYGCVGSLNFDDFKMFFPLLLAPCFAVYPSDQEIIEGRELLVELFNFPEASLSDASRYFGVMKNSFLIDVLGIGSAADFMGRLGYADSKFIYVLQKVPTKINCDKFGMFISTSESLTDWFLEKCEVNKDLNIIFSNSPSSEMLVSKTMLSTYPFNILNNNFGDSSGGVRASFYYHFNHLIFNDPIKLHHFFPFLKSAFLWDGVHEISSSYTTPHSNLKIDGLNTSKALFVNAISESSYKTLFQKPLGCPAFLMKDLLTLASIGFILIFISLFIKLAIAPFHFWSLDVYEGSPNATTFFFLVVPKIALLVLLLRICYSSFYHIFSTNQSYFLFFAVLSIFVGSLGGLEQRKLKTLLAYSSISHTGYLLLSFSTNTFEGMQMMLYYIVIYMIASLCFWSIYLFIRQKQDYYVNKHNKELGDLVLLKDSNPMVAFILAITLFSIAGIPPIVGFLAKIGIFLVVVRSSAYLVSLISILFSVASTFYYIRFIKVLYFENVLVGKLYFPISTKKSLLMAILALSLIVLCVDPMILYLLFHKATLLSNQ